jgi:BASS family bile acid:Na+ symporter
VFLLVGVVVPSLAGMVLRRLLGGPRVARLRPALKLVNAVVLLVLCYANASVSLPQVVAEPDWDQLALVVAAVSALCLSAFAAGWFLARLLAVGEAQARSLMFGLGMNNNGTGMVLACASLPTLPGAVLPVLAYNLVQHLVAGGVSRWLPRAVR